MALRGALRGKVPARRGAGTKGGKPGPSEISRQKGLANDGT